MPAAHMPKGKTNIRRGLILAITITPPTVAGEIDPIATDKGVHHNTQFPTHQIVEHQGEPVAITSIMGILLVQGYYIIDIQGGPTSATGVRIERFSETIQGQLFTPNLSEIWHHILGGPYTK